MPRSASVRLVLALLLLSPVCLARTNWDDLVPAVVRKLEKEWKLTTGEVNLLEHPCDLSTIKTQHSYYRGTLSCPDWTNITGEALSRNSFGVVDDVTRNFFKKAIRKGLVNLEETDRWVSL